MPGTEPIKFNCDAGVRTFQFLNGKNITAVSGGVGTNIKNTSIYASLLAGYDSGSKSPALLGFGTVETKYPDQGDNFWVSSELYGEFCVEKGVFAPKITCTPVKVNANIGKVNVSFDPRVAIPLFQEGATPKLETLTTVSAPIYKNLAGYVMLQTYDTTQKPEAGNFGVNAGLIYNF